MNPSLPRRLDTDDKYCILEYTPLQRRNIAAGEAFPPDTNPRTDVQFSFGSCSCSGRLASEKVVHLSANWYEKRSNPQMVPGNPHAMVISTGLVVGDDGIARPHIVTEEVPGVLVASEDFVSGYFYGMVAAYEESDYGEQAFTEQHIMSAFVSTATDVVMLQGRDMPIEFSIGHLFGYFRGCTLIGTQAFDEWIERDGMSA
jgi:hypothetical protein